MSVTPTTFQELYEKSQKIKNSLASVKAKKEQAEQQKLQLENQLKELLGEDWETEFAKLRSTVESFKL